MPGSKADHQHTWLCRKKSCTGAQNAVRHPSCLRGACTLAAVLQPQLACRFQCLRACRSLLPWLAGRVRSMPSCRLVVQQGRGAGEPESGQQGRGDMQQRLAATHSSTIMSNQARCTRRAAAKSDGNECCLGSFLARPSPGMQVTELHDREGAEQRDRGVETTRTKCFTGLLLPQPHRPALQARPQLHAHQAAPLSSLTCTQPQRWPPPQRCPGCRRRRPHTAAPLPGQGRRCTLAP